ncbi:MAG: sigma-70 family RNA polymerase sigma factor [Planctomycetes bacterium]|nr:sigma-70 family RNA polymerase sigma factor [Planctomycetota bacterium]
MSGLSDVTQILNSIEQGDAHAAEQLLPVVYQELRRLAAKRLANERAGQTLQATALVHEAYVRLVDGDQDRRWNSRGHFYAAAAEAMRRILIDNARRKNAQVHGGHLNRIDADVGTLEIGLDVDDRLIAIDDALDRFSQHHPQQAQLVKLRFFAGLTMEEAAASLDISPATAGRYWRYARAWLNREMSPEDWVE